MSQPQRPLTREVEFVREARAAGALHDVTGLFEKGQAFDHSETVDVIRQRLEQRQCGLFLCGDMNHFDDKLSHFKTWVAQQPHILADNGGAILLDPKVRPVPRVDSAHYWTQRILQSVQLQGLDDFYIEAHSSCGQGRALGMMAYDICLSACIGKAKLKRAVRKIREGKIEGRPFRIGILFHFYDGERRRWYYAERNRIQPVAMRYTLGQQTRTNSTRPQLAGSGGGW